MNLSLYTGGVKPYLEYGWVCAPNTAGQSITANTITTLTIDTEVADTGNFGSVASNQITLAAGTYYFDADIALTATAGDITLGLYNTTASQYVSRRKITSGISGNTAAYVVYYYSPSFRLVGQFSITTSSVFDLRLVSSVAATNGSGTAPLSNSTAGADQRTTIKLWKLA
jgi:hypothetical protein